MRNRLSFAAATVLFTAVSVQAQQSASSGSVDFSVSVTDVSGDAARFQRYRDMRDRGSIEALRFDSAGNGWRFESRARHLGRTDQWISGVLRTPKVKASFSWDQIPYYVSGDTRTLFTAESPGVLRIDDAIQSAVQNGQLGLVDAVGAARRFDLRSHRDVAVFDLTYSPTRLMDVKVKVKQTHREGAQAFGASFGFSNAAEVPAPIDTRTRDVNADVEWAGGRGMVRVGYDGSWFENDVSTLVWDNPWKATDAIGATSQGRLALPPSSTMHGVSSAAALALPAHTRLTASVRSGLLRQNAALLPATINPAIPEIALPRETADAEARTLAMNYAVTSRPSKYVWLNARFRYYDFNNRTPVFAVSQRVNMDQTLAAGVSTTPTSYTRQTIDVDASVTPFASTTLRGGYTRAIDDRTFRMFERTTDNVYRASIDSMWKMIMLRGMVERAERRGSGFDEELLVEAHEQPAMRHYDIADRDRRRVTGLVQVMPLKALAFSGSVAVGEDDYTNSGFGLRDNTNRVYSVTLDVMPAQRIAGTATYSREKYTALQASRYSNSAALSTDPTRDWSVDTSDNVETIGASLDLLKLLPRTDIRLGYDYSRSNAAYVYGVPASSTLAALVQLPTVRNELRSATGEVRFFLTKQLALGGLFWYDDYQVDDFARRPETLGSLATTGSLFLGSVYRPYTATSGALRLMYVW